MDNPRLRGLVRMYNVIGVSLSLGLTKMPTAPLLDSIGTIFSKKPQIADVNKQVAEFAYNYAVSALKDFGHVLPGTAKDSDTIVVQGYYGTALGKIAAGCRFQSYYPITPASDESNYLESHEIVHVQNNRLGCTAVIQTEDEISAIGMMIGSALTGTRSSTCTSGPGFALMTEALGWAGINEVPVVVTLYQRSGPSTGACLQDTGKTICCSLSFQDVVIFQRSFMPQGTLRRVSMIRQTVLTILTDIRFL